MALSFSFSTAVATVEVVAIRFSPFLPAGFYTTVVAIAVECNFSFQFMGGLQLINGD